MGAAGSYQEQLVWKKNTGLGVTEGILRKKFEFDSNPPKVLAKVEVWFLISCNPLLEQNAKPPPFFLPFFITVC